jgi:hypothetical protein
VVENFATGKVFFFVSVSIVAFLFSRAVFCYTSTTTLDGKDEKDEI